MAVAAPAILDMEHLACEWSEYGSDGDEDVDIDPSAFRIDATVSGGRINSHISKLQAREDLFPSPVLL